MGNVIVFSILKAYFPSIVQDLSLQLNQMSCFNYVISFNNAHNMHKDNG